MSDKKEETNKLITEKSMRIRLIEMGISQTYVAKVLGISSQDVNMVISGKSKSPKYIKEVKKYLGLD